MTRDEKVNLIEAACNEENCGSDCKFRDICDRGSAYSVNWLDADLDEAVRRLGIDPETGEKLAAAQKEEDETVDGKIRILGHICATTPCSDCKLSKLCHANGFGFGTWANHEIDEALRAVDIDPENSEKLAAIIADLDARPETDWCHRRHPDVVNHPQHYELPNGLECIDAMVATLGKETVMAFCKANAFKYLWRHERKNGAEDVEKARWYLNKWHDLQEASDEAR